MTEVPDTQKDVRPAALVGQPSTTELEVRLLGGFELRNRAGESLRLRKRKAEALLAVLALQPGQSLSRGKLCALLWPGVSDAQSRHSLRQTLLYLRKVLPKHRTILHSNLRTVQLSATQVSVDVALLERAVAIGTRESYFDAAQLYRGDLLEGVSVPEDTFEHWLKLERERVRALVDRALSSLVPLETTADRLYDASQVCLRLLQVDPLREQAHRTLMQILVRQGRRAAALEHYHALVSSLRAELGVAPEAETEQLYATIDADSKQLSAALATASASGPTGQSSIGLITAGRERELARLIAALPALDPCSHAGVILLLGEAGVGKTHMCDRVAAAVEVLGLRVLRARCFESEQVLPLSLWANLLSDAVARDDQLLSGIPAVLRTALSSYFPEIMQERVEQAPMPPLRQLFQAMYELLTRLADSARLVVVLEDIHWADELSVRLLCYVGRQLQTRFHLLTSARSEELPNAVFLQSALAELERERRLERIQLEPLSAPESRDLASQLAHRHALPVLSDARLDQIWTISEGNPLVIVETIHVLSCGSFASDVTQLPVPERVRSLIVSRVAKVSQTAREVLSLAAVAGREIDVRVLEAALDTMPLCAALEELLRVQLLQACDEHVYFSHDRIRETLYREMLPSRRRLLHLRMARALEARGTGSHTELGQIGYHHSHAGNGVEAVGYLLRFADKAWRSHGVHEALAALEQALLDSAHLPDAGREKIVAEIVIRQSYCLTFLGRFQELAARLQPLALQMDSLDAPELAGPLHFFWAFALVLMAARREAEAHARQAIEFAARCGDTRVTGYAHALLSYLCAMTGRCESGVEHGLVATKALARTDNSPEGSAIAWLSLSLNRLWLGDLRAAIQATQTGEAIARAADNPRGQALAATAAGCAYAYTEQWELALEATERSVANSKDPFTLVSALWMTAWARSGSGQVQEAISLSEFVLKQLEQHNMHAWRAHAMTILADALVRAGDARRAANVADEARSIAQATDDRPCVGWAMRVRGRAACALGDFAAARAFLDDSIALFDELAIPIDVAKGLVERAEVSLADGARATEQADLERAHALFSACGVLAPLARVERLLQELRARTGAS